MRLTAPQQRMLDGGEGALVQRLMRLLVRLGEVYGAGAMVEVASVQIAGISYKSIGEPGLEFLEDVAAQGVQAKAYATINPAGMDLVDWRELGFPEAFAVQQQRIIAAFRRMGVLPSATCTPYLAGNLPRFGEHLAWAESSAVSYANSVLGARTNREGGPSALAVAICGCTPDHGLHRDEQRRPTVAVHVTASLRTRADFGALGYLVGQRVQDGRPYFTGIVNAGGDELKALGAAMAASGAVAMYHVEGHTPEAAGNPPDGVERFAVGEDELCAAYAQLNTGPGPSPPSPDLVVLGCPHASLREVREVARKLEGKALRRPLWVCTSRMVKDAATALGLTRTIEQAGGRVVADTCMVVAPIEQMGIATTAVDSGKAAAYLPGFCRQQVVFRDLDALLAEAMS